jgi:hypothetical protein
LPLAAPESLAQTPLIPSAIVHPQQTSSLFNILFRMRIPPIVALLLALSCSSGAQWHMQDSHTSAQLRGIQSIGDGIAWASGTSGTVLRTTDDGDHWQLCAAPPGGEALDFRGIQAFDANAAIVMSIGKGDLSRLYKTTDACHSWKLVFTNPDKDGFWDSLLFSKPLPTQPAEASGVLIGDPVAGTFAVFLTADSGDTWRRWGRGEFGRKGQCGERQAKALKDEGLFAASNESVLHFSSGNFLFVTGGQSGTRLVYSDRTVDGPPCWISFPSIELPLARGSSSAGAFAVAAKNATTTYFPLRLMIVGGDYMKPDVSSGNTAFLSSKDGARVPFSSYFTVITPVTPPHGFRSAVAYDAPTNTWVTVGPNGTDISTDDGLNWRALKPAPTDAPDADKNWNALSLPFVVGPKGRIGKLRTEALKP